MSAVAALTVYAGTQAPARLARLFLCLALLIIGNAGRFSLLRLQPGGLLRQGLSVRRNEKPCWFVSTKSASGIARQPLFTPTLLDGRKCHHSIRTMCRLLERRGESCERRNQLTHPPHHRKPELLATAPQPTLEPVVHYGQAESILRERQAVLAAAYQLHSERLVRSAPKPPALPSEAWINKPFHSHEKLTKLREHLSQVR